MYKGVSMVKAKILRRWSNLMAPIIYCFCSNCSCPASALVSLARGQEEEEGGERMDQGQRVTRMELERNNSSMESLLFLLVVLCLMLGMSFCYCVYPALWRCRQNVVASFNGVFLCFLTPLFFSRKWVSKGSDILHMVLIHTNTHMSCHAVCMCAAKTPFVVREIDNNMRNIFLRSVPTVCTDAESHSQWPASQVEHGQGGGCLQARHDLHAGKRQ